MSKDIHYYCNILGISPADLSKEKVKRGYRLLGLAWHPDKHPEEYKKEATAKFQAIHDAYEILVDDEKRRRLLLGQCVSSQNVCPAQQYTPPMSAQQKEYKFDVRDYVAYFNNTNKPIEIAANAANKKLVDSFEKKTEEIFAEAYAKYKTNSESYYAKYKKSLYGKYVQSKKEPLDREIAVAEATYDQKAKPAKIAIIVGLATFFLGLPLIAAGIGYYFMRKADKAKQAAITSLNEQYKCKSQDKWEEEQVNVKTKEQWEHNGQYSLEEFILPNNKTDEGVAAQATYDKLKEECLLKCKANSEVAIKQTLRMVRRTSEEAKLDIVDELTSYISPHQNAEAPRSEPAANNRSNSPGGSAQETTINPPSPELSPFNQQHRPPSPLALA